jgi:hypothetical protein
MSKNKLTEIKTTAQAYNWLDKKISNKFLINVHCNELSKIPPEKGLYFWFIKTETLESLFKMNSNITYNIEYNGNKYALAYIGSAGTGKKKQSNLNERLKWHLCQQHTESNVRSGILSTLRTGISAMLSDDLILPNTESATNDFLCENMLVNWVEFQLEEEHLIDETEKLLIKILKPVFNIKNNPNSKSNSFENITKLYKERRSIIKESTMRRLEKSMKTNGNSEINYKNTTISNNNLVMREKQCGCLEYIVSKNQNIADVTMKIQGLTLGPCKIRIWDSSNPKNEFMEWHRTTGRNSKGQNIYSYFKNTPSNSNKTRAEVISNWMETNNIYEITVSICPLNNQPKQSKKINNMIIQPNNLTQESLILSKNFKIVMVCANKKKSSFLTGYQNLEFVANPIYPNDVHTDNAIAQKQITWREYLSENQNDPNLLSAYDLYNWTIYQNMQANLGDRFYILSAGWGLVKSEFKLPKYDITFSPKAPLRNRREPIPVIPFNDFNHLNNDESMEDIIYIGSHDYLTQFYLLTQHLKCRKIVYYKKINVPLSKPAPNKTFLFRQFITNRRTNWYHELGDLMINGIIP